MRFRFAIATVIPICIGAFTNDTAAQTKLYLGEYKFNDPKLYVMDPGGANLQELSIIPTADWLKNAVDGYSFVNCSEYHSIASHMAKFKYMVGHNRAATMGGIDTETAHPFQEGAITLVHNGTLRPHFRVVQRLSLRDRRLRRHLSSERRPVRADQCGRDGGDMVHHNLVHDGTQPPHFGSGRCQVK